MRRSPHPLNTGIERDLESGVTTVRLAGELTTSGIRVVRLAMSKAAAECPSAVVVDLSRFRHTDPRQLGVFATATHEAQAHWGVSVLLCHAGREVIDGLGPIRTRVALYEDRHLALLAVRAHVPRWIRRRFAPRPPSAGQARSLVGVACVSWELPQLRDPARLVASELANNAIQHAGTDFQVITAWTGQYLRIAVQDGSPAAPRVVGEPPATGRIMAPGTGRGLRMITAASAHWGVTRTPGGKIVWALLRPHPDLTTDATI
ncbi:ATP-binding protein [Actinoplanes siamensis]|uniref:ATP-binding protein n=1 Tax=Actinoplanes siamensis TaxID=1223317 RepID=UPI0019455570|nr:ATP-binding protein [Actinoplanes siamensis]